MRNLAIALALVISLAAGAGATLLVNEEFTHPDGSLVPNTPTPGPGAAWATHSGVAGDLLVSSGQAIVQHGAPSEDANTDFGVFTAGALFYGFDFSVADPGAVFGTDTEYFAHFKDTGTDFTSRLHVEGPLGGGNFTGGISGSSSAAGSMR